jgi:hypothetical protein
MKSSLHLYIIKTLKSENYFFYFTLLPVMNIYVNFFNKIVLSVSQTKIHMYLKLPKMNNIQHTHYFTSYYFSICTGETRKEFQFNCSTHRFKCSPVSLH